VRPTGLQKAVGLTVSFPFQSNCRAIGGHYLAIDLTITRYKTAF